MKGPNHETRGPQVVNISERRVQPICVERLRDALERAERGEAQAVAIVVLTDNDRVVTAWGGEFRPDQLVGAIERLKFRLSSAILEEE